MRPISASASIDASRERVHELLVDLAARPAFTDHFLDEYRLLQVDTHGVGAGARFRVIDTQGWMDSVIAEVERPHRIVERGRGGRLNRVPTYTVWELVAAPGPGGCELTVTFWSEPSNPFEWVRERTLVRRLRRGWGRALTRLKQLVEEGGEVERIRVGGASRIGL